MLRFLEGFGSCLTNTQELLNNLLAMKRSGELDVEEIVKSDDRKLWRGLLPYDTLRWLVSTPVESDEIQLSALALLVESKKSTLPFTEGELSTILQFVRININRKLDFVPLIKKALKRMQDSLVVITRQFEVERMKQEKSVQFVDYFKYITRVYFDTLVSLRSYCVCSPDATYYNRQSSLQILILMRDIIRTPYTGNTWKASDVQALFQTMLLDTYEGNKEMAFNLIQSIVAKTPSLLQLEKESNVSDIITVAIELANSIRPIDSVTAAYMLKVALLSPVIKNVIQNEYSLMKQPEGEIKQKTRLLLILILLEKLKNVLTLAKENIVKTVTKHSVYGYIFCIRHLLKDCNLNDIGAELAWQDIIAECVSICFEFSRAVSLIVNNSSPEGHLPMDLNLQAINEICSSLPEKQIVTPQMVLLCSWRTVKEVSLIFGFLAVQAPISKDDTVPGLLNEEQIIRIGEHLVALLMETKHRGAFEQAHVGFSQLCTRLWRSDKTTLKQLPKVWLHQILIAIAGIKEDNSKLCATRRSAGVPFMIQALVCTEPRQHKDTKTATFRSVMKLLLGFTQLENTNSWDKIKELLYTDSVFSEYENSEEFLKYSKENSIQVSEVKTHALNVLRAIFRHSNLAEVVKDYVADGLIAAFKSNDAVTWAERNAATLLFSALIIRIFGVQRTKDHINLTADNKMSYGIFFRRYPSLLPFILNELQTFHAMDDDIIKPNVHSILLLLSRLHRIQGSEPNSIWWKINVLETLHRVMHCAKSVIYETRKLAARALASLLTEVLMCDVLSEIMENVISAPEKHLPLNSVHGYMLQIHEIIKHFGVEKLRSSGPDWNRFFNNTTWILKSVERGNSNPVCFLLAAEYINVCNGLLRADKMYPMEHGVTMLNILVPHLLHYNLLKEGPAREMYQTSVFKFILSVSKEPLLVAHSQLIRVYFSSLRNSDTQMISLNTVIEFYNEDTQRDTVQLLLDYTDDFVFNTLQDVHKFSPELLDAMFNFLYHGLVHSDTNKMNICAFVLNKLRSSDNKIYYCERDSYLRLLGQSYVTVTASMDDDKKVRSLSYTSEVYNSLCDNPWIASLDGSFRDSVFKILDKLLRLCLKQVVPDHALAQCWTTILQLLLNNNQELRYLTCIMLNSFQENFLLMESNDDGVTHKFLEICYEHTHKERSILLCVLLFCWNVSLFDDTNYEMDETDVFNKGTNYEFFEPLRLSEILGKFIERIGKYVDHIVPDDTVDWVNTRLGVELPKSVSFRTLVREYEAYVSSVNNKLHDILDPTYKNKLLKGLAYKEFMNHSKRWTEDPTSIENEL